MPCICPQQFQVSHLCGITMGITIDGEEYDIEREQLELVIEEELPCAWIAEAILCGADEQGEKSAVGS